VAQALLEGVGENDIVARFGGEEFCLLLKGSDKDGGWCLLEELRKNIQENAMATTGQEEPVFVTISGGLCAGRLGCLNDMIKAADDNLYRAKQNGRNIIVS
jgi:diguanylate cyclase (GGDEF)-like protein